MVDLPSELTPEQKAILPKYEERWRAIMLNTDPCDFEGAKKAAIKCYKLAGQDPPKKFYVTRSPNEGAHLAAELKLKEKDKDAKLDPEDPEHRQLISESFGEMIYGFHEGHWVGFYEFLMKECGVTGLEEAQGLIDMAQVCGWWASYKDVAIFQDRPKELHYNEQGELHNENGPAVLYRDGWACYSWNGMRISPSDAWILTNPERITVDSIRKQNNAELRRIMVEKMGLDKYLAASETRLIDMDSLTLEGSATRALVEDGEGDRWLVGTDGSTKRMYFMPVDKNAETCVEAHNRIAGFNENRLIVEA